MDYQHNFKKKFGQNFLNDENILNKIVKEAEIPEDTLVIEIGPGAGALTNKVKDVAKNVLAYEIDLDLQNILIDKFKDTNVEFIWEDFLNRNIKEDIKDYEYSHIFVVANIPYYITTPIVEKIINSGVDVEKVVIMVQKEVGDRFSAKPGNKEYGSISVFLNYYYDIKELFIVSKNCFTPRPNVDSVILSLTKRKDKPEVKDEKTLFRLIKDSFRFKRKNLRNNLKEYDLLKIEEVLKKYNKDLTARAETLDLNIFVDISNNI
jgi:16S rRNA (adenine1518-N6/adenine1519-N6)-dimethyltransferase